MKIEKRKNYFQTLTLNGIDTLSGYIPQQVTQAEIKNGVGVNLNQCNFQTKASRTFLLINPNKRAGESEKLITNYSEFVEKMTYILSSIGSNLSEFDVVRCDFCFNSTEKGSFREFQKLHKLIISCLALCYYVKNCYISNDLWDGSGLSVAIKADTFEAENYDKARQTEETEPYSNRLELRGKRLHGKTPETTIEHAFLSLWFDRLDNARKCFDAVQEKANTNLEQLYKSDKAKPPKEQAYLNLNAFLLQYRDSIYTKKQLIDLLSRFDEVQNPAKRAARFKEQHKIEFFSQKDLDFVVQTLKDKATDYFKK